MNLNPQLVEQEISNLLLAYPDLADDERLRADMIEGATTTHEFLSAVMRQFGDNDALLEGLEYYIDELLSRAKRLKRRDEALRVLVFRLLQRANLSSVQLPEATLSIRNGTPQLIGDADPSTLPELYRRVKYEVNRTAIKDHLKSGMTVEGFSLSNSEPTLSIRRT